MSRGRQRAMAKKVAREIKYFNPNTDYDALTSELSVEKNFENSLTGGTHAEDIQARGTRAKGVQSDEFTSELEEYLEWVKQTADECATGKKMDNVK